MADSGDNNIVSDGSYSDLESVVDVDEDQVPPKATASLSQTPSRPKRKASPLYKTALKKSAQTPSSSLASKAKGTTSLTAKGNMAFSDMVFISFMDPNFLQKVAPVFHSLVAPTIQIAIDSAVQTAVDRMKASVLDPIVDTNTKLQETVSSQMNIIQTQREELETQVKTLKENSDKIEVLEKQINHMSKEFATLKMTTNNLEQYGRRNSLRFVNLKLDVGSNAPEIELKKEVVKFINKNMLVDGSHIETADIDRCHPIGRGKPGGQPPIIVKFNKYQTKHMVYAAKVKLGKKPMKVFVSEDLTQTNYAIVRKLQTLKKSGQICSFWTTNGKVWAKEAAEDSPVRFSDVDDVYSFVSEVQPM